MGGVVCRGSSLVGKYGMVMSRRMERYRWEDGLAGLWAVPLSNGLLLLVMLLFTRRMGYREGVLL